MITERSIEDVKDAIDIVKVAENLCQLKLTKKGANYFAISPYNDGEKTGSFCISESRQQFKCFSTGEGGDAIKLLMDLKRYDFPEAIRELAQYFNVTIEETAAREEDRELKEKKANLFDVNRAAAKHWRESLYDLPGNHWANRELIQHRKLHPDTILEFQLGYAPHEWQFLSDRMVKNGYYQHGVDAGLIKTSDARFFDVYRDRIIFPIHDQRGNIVGFGGRKGDDGDKENPKYINSKASPIYRKEKVLYGLYQAQDHIRKEKQAIVVEGYYDVLAMHQAGVRYTVATCGTAITESHAQVLQRLCKHVTLMCDSDKAGIAAMLKATDILVQTGLRVDVCPMPKDQDPDSFVRSISPGPFYGVPTGFDYHDESVIRANRIKMVNDYLTQEEEK